MILEILVASVFIATIFNIVLHKFNMPTIIGYILTWIIVSYSFWLWDIVSNHELKSIAEFGIVFLLFTIGLEFSLPHLKKMKKNVFFFWSMQFFITTLVFYSLSTLLFWIGITESIIIALWLSLSSTAIVLKILNENWSINKYYWNRSTWILIFQDLMVIPIMLLITVFADNNTDIWVLIWKTFLNALILLVSLWIIARFLLDRFLYKVASTWSNEIFIWSILFIIIWASLLAHSLWFSFSLWAFLAGMLIAETHYKHQVEADLIPFRDILLWFFFVTVWMQLDMVLVWKNIIIILILLSTLMVIKISILHTVLVWFNHKRSSFKTAISLSQFWEFWIVIFELAIFKKLLNPEIWQILIVVIILSMFITPVILKNITAITDFLFWSKYRDWDWHKISKYLKNHIILIWYWRHWRMIASILEEKKNWLHNHWKWYKNL